MSPRVNRIVFDCLLIVLSVSYSKCDEYTREEKMLIPKLYNRVKMNLTQDVMHENIYLVRYLRAQHNNVDRAEAMLRRTLEWRKENKMDSILTENWTGWIRRVPFSDTFVDYDGRGTLGLSMAFMDVRRFLIAGRGDEFLRYLIFILEHALHGLSVVDHATRADLVDGYAMLNFAGFDYRTHLCHPCIPLWQKFLNICERHYPFIARSIFVVNAPRILPNLRKLYPRDFEYMHTIEIVRVFDFDKGAWSRELLKIFPKDVLTAEFGGTAQTQYVQTQYPTARPNFHKYIYPPRLNATKV